MHYRYEQTEAGKRSFWEITAHGRRLSIRHGAVGTVGKRESWSQESALEAEKELHERCLAKIAEGYELVQSDCHMVDGTDASAVHRDDALEAAIAESFEEKDAYLVYADALSEAGDPRGELIALQCNLEGETDPTRFLDIQTKARSHLAQNQQLIFDALFEHQADIVVRWRRGFVDELRVKKSADVPGVVSALGRAPVLCFLRQLAIDVVDEEGAAALIEASLPHLDQLDLAWAYVEKRLHAGPAHEELCAHILAGTLAPRIQRLTLARTPNTNELCERICTSAIAPRLRHLDLEGGKLTTEGLEHLCRAKTAGNIGIESLAALGQNANEMVSGLFSVTRPRRRK